MKDFDNSRFYRTKKDLKRDLWLDADDSWIAAEHIGSELHEAMEDWDKDRRYGGEPLYRHQDE